MYKRFSVCFSGEKLTTQWSEINLLILVLPIHLCVLALYTQYFPESFYLLFFLEDNTCEMNQYSMRF